MPSLTGITSHHITCITGITEITEMTEITGNSKNINYSLTHSVTDNLNSRDASASKNSKRYLVSKYYWPPPAFLLAKLPNPRIQQQQREMDSRWTKLANFNCWLSKCSPPPALTENRCEKKKVFFLSGKGGYPPPLNGKSAKLFREIFS